MVSIIIITLLGVEPRVLNAPLFWNIDAFLDYGRFSRLLTFFWKLRLPPNFGNVPCFQILSFFKVGPSWPKFGQDGAI